VNGRKLRCGLGEILLKASVSRRSSLCGAVALAGLVALAASACASSSGSGRAPASSSASPTGSPAASLRSSTGSAAGVAAAEAQLTQYEGLVTSFRGPGPALSDPGALRGKTFTYVPFFLEAPYFQAEVQLLKQAAAVVGMKMTVCDAQATPTGATACIRQAAGAKSAGIITDSIPYNFAGNAYAAAAAANIPVVAGDIADPVPAELTGHAITMDMHENVVGELVADEIIANSSGTANPLLVDEDDEDENFVTDNAILHQFAADCPRCKITQVPYHDTSLQLIPTAVSTALLRDRSINYVFIHYDEPAGPLVFQGMQTAHATDAKVVSMGAFAYGLQNVASGKEIADVNSDPATGAWDEADALFRMITKSEIPPPSAYQLPIRVFDESNVAGLALTTTVYDSGAWYTNGAYRTVYRRLWTS
jgi:ribose transport system substrate-binding protein